MYLEELKKLTPKEILEGEFGLEWESLRVKKDGTLALTPHPEIFGDKTTNPIVTTDFSESQLELITKTYTSIDETYEIFTLLFDLVNANLPDDEYLWFHSMPCILPDDDKIPIARYGDEGKENEEYRMNLAKKYGLKKQMISGVHYNFSFSKNILEKLTGGNQKLTDEIYLKIARNYLRYCWLIIYLTGCSNACDESFTDEAISLCEIKDNDRSYYSRNATSLRNSICGYKNLERLSPRYDSVVNFTEDVKSYIDKKILSEAKELYTQIRLKPKNPNNLLESLITDGIKYIEIRTLDISPYKYKLIKEDMEFLHIFLIYMLVKPESDYENWQIESQINEERVAENGLTPNLELIRDGEDIKLKTWALEIIDEIYEMCDELKLDKDLLYLMYDKIISPELTYSNIISEVLEKEGFIEGYMKVSIKNKEKSKKTDFEKIKDYIPIALPNRT